MAFAFHHDQERYWRMQYLCAREYIIPFLESECQLNLRGKNVLEIGCGEGGVAAAFFDHGCHAVGTDISEARLQKAAALAATGGTPRAIKFVSANILEPAQAKAWRQYFDVIVMKDVIEHLPDHQRALGHVATLLKPRGCLFVSFPPWYMPFGAHQQMFGSILKFIPFTHLLPRSWFRKLAHRFGEPPALVEELAGLYSSRLTLTAFNKLLRQAPFAVVRTRLYLINPMYKYKFGLRPIPHPAFVARLPVIRELMTTVCYCTLQLQETALNREDAKHQKISSNV
jgi:2-polyprenyl-3-methyl-5-hydroxy-6-metoxy-1,4-benzoquinol methylase